MIKSLLIVLSLVTTFTMVACSSSSSDKPAGGGGGSVVEKAVAGAWVSDCLQDDRGFFFDKITMQNGNGTSTQEYMQNQDCSGAIMQTQGPTAFQYTSGVTIGNSTEVTLTFTGKPAIKANITVDGPKMTITAENKTLTYHKLEPISHAPNAPTGNDFDRAATGTWVTQNCTLADSTRSYVTVLTFSGNGQGSQVYNVYQNQRCEGNAQAEGSTNFTYTVDRFANGGGQITINNEPIDIIIEGNSMTANSAQGSIVFKKIN